MNDKVDAYIARAELWPDEITALRPILLGTGLSEEYKWGKPCYAHEGSNIVIIQQMKAHLALMFFKGALIDDPDGVLEEQGPNSRSAKRMTFTSVDEVESAAGTIRAYVAAAVDAEERGVEAAPAEEREMAPELAARLEQDDDLRKAFEALTPGRRREYSFHISEAKRSETRERRIDRFEQWILDGKGMRDR